MNTITEHNTAPRTSARLIRWTALAGIAGPVVFTVGFLVQEQFRRGEYDPVAEVVSALEAGDHGWVQQANFVVLGLLTVGFAIGLHRAIAPSRAGFVGPVAMFVSGMAAVLAAIFPLREDALGATYDPGGHQFAGTVFFASSAIALIALSRRCAADPAMRSLARWLLAAGALSALSFPVMGILVIPDDAPLHQWAGLAQRFIVLGLLFPARIALALQLLKRGPHQGEAPLL